MLGKLIKQMKRILFWKSKRTKTKDVRRIFTKDYFVGKPYDIGEFSYGEPEIFQWGEDTNLRIGKFCSIAKGVKIFLGGNHRVEWNTTYPLGKLIDGAVKVQGHPSSKGDVQIGNDVWIGHGVTILSGVRIGDGACIGAMSVVAKDVPPYAIVAGNPSKIIKFRFNQEKIVMLLNIAWWDWPIEKILENSELLQSEKNLIDES